MTVSVRDVRELPADRRWLESVYRDYLDDLAPLNTGVFPILGEVGHSEPDQLARWFADSSAHLLLILKGAQPAGFAMVARGGPGFGRAPMDFRMAEFFIARLAAIRLTGSGRARATTNTSGRFNSSRSARAASGMVTRAGRNRCGSATWPMTRSPSPCGL